MYPRHRKNKDNKSYADYIAKEVREGRLPKNVLQGISKIDTDRFYRQGHVSCRSSTNKIQL